MKEFELTRVLFGKTITAKIIQFETELHVSVFGGDRPHIGSVSIDSQDDLCLTREFRGHRDGVISERWANLLAGENWSLVVVEAGIHYDCLDRQGIQAVLKLTDEMLRDVTEMLKT